MNIVDRAGLVGVGERAETSGAGAGGDDDSTFRLVRRSKGMLLATAATAVLALAATAPAPALAQEEEEAEGEAERIVVTGSRIRRDEFTSASPLQVLNTQEAVRLGVSTVTDLLQQTTIAAGRQIDLTINTNSGNSNATEAPPEGGVGSSNINLRGLGPERTLILLNGRRLGFAGVRGAPAQPDINLLPISAVDTVEITTEGASAIYGADAVAGVVNVLLRDDFEGFEFKAEDRKSVV